MSRPAPAIDFETLPANDALDSVESLSELETPPITNPSIPELIDDLPEDPEADGLDPIRLALAVRGIDPSLLDEPIVDDFDGSDAVLEDDDDVEDVDDHEAVFDDDFEEVSGEMMVDESSVSFDEPEDEEPIRSVKPLPTPPPTPPRKG